MPDVSPKLAEKVLAANLRNVIQKVSTGSTLSTPEREIMEQCLATDAVPEDLQKARAAALIRKWASGGKLSKEEQKEVGGYLPDDKPVVRRIGSDRYQHPYRHYAAQLGLQGGDPERTLKRWVADGRKQTPPDFPPFDNLDQLANWWRRVKVWRVPDFILKLEGRAETSPPAQGSPATATGEKEAATAEVPLPAMQLRLGGDMAADLGLQQVRALVDATFRQLQAALAQNRPQQAAQLRREWKEYVNTLRQWEKDIVKIQEGKGEVLRTRVISSEVTSMFAVFAQSFTNAMLALAEKLAPMLPAPERRAVVLPLRDGVFVHLKRTRFREEWDATRQHHPALELDVTHAGSV